MSSIREKVDEIKNEYHEILTSENGPDKAELFDVYHKHFIYLLNLAEERASIE